MPGLDFFEQLKILRGFERRHVMKISVAKKIRAAAELQSVFGKNTGAVRRRIQPLRDDGFRKREIGVVGNQRPAGGITERAILAVDEINRRIGAVFDAEVRRNILGDKRIFDAGQFAALRRRRSPVAERIFVRKKILLDHVFGMVIGGALQLDSKLKRLAIIFGAGFVANEKDGGMKQRIVDALKVDGLVEKLIAAEAFVSRGLVVFVAPYGLRKSCRIKANGKQQAYPIFPSHVLSYLGLTINDSLDEPQSYKLYQLNPSNPFTKNQ
jgi:hypothetical protein